MTPVCSSVTEATTGFRRTRFSTRAQIALAACACGGATAFLYAVDPNRHAIYPQCLLYNTTGIYCAGCGATRAVYALLHGRVIEALHDNALFIAALPLLLYVAGSHALAAWRANAWPAIFVDGRKLAWRGVFIFFLIMAFMILRNLPGRPFDWLKPLAM
ncbi:MAG TPA: DUF2752 domain-containing protein [Candidatus Methylacidiphilales bacterium]|jgi:hypothetical protein|nr:DUF2752 domain-containing protein [Candidatus Methylacidiphilales bacterium]